jgi:hypothetical protein
MTSMTEHADRSPRVRLAERLSAACYGTVLVLASLAAIHVADVSSGLGWELVTGVGVATWVAHLYAEVVGEHVRHSAAIDRHEIATAMADGLPILLAAVPPAVMLLLGRLDVLDETVAHWAAVGIAFAQLVVVGVIVGSAATARGGRGWPYAVATIAIGLVIVSLKLVLGH